MVYILFVIMFYILVGGLILQFMYHHQSVYFIFLMVYIHVVFIYIVYVFIHIYPWFYFLPIVGNLSMIGWTLLGSVCICVTSYAAKCVFWNM